MRLNILSGGAAKSVVNALAGGFRAATEYELIRTFSAVGAMKAKLLGGAPADLVILTQAQISELAAAGLLLPESCANLGRVRRRHQTRCRTALHRAAYGRRFACATHESGVRTWNGVNPGMTVA